MKYTVLHALSGGIDSASVLHQLLEQGHTPLLYHIKIAGRRADDELQATERIVAWCNERYGVKLTCQLSSGQLYGGVYDIELAALVGGGILRLNRSITTVTISTSADDTKLPHWQKRHNNRVAIVEALANRKLEWLNPNISTRRADVIKQLPPDLLSLCSFCRAPVKGQPCRTCQTCRMTLPTLRELAHV